MLSKILKTLLLLLIIFFVQILYTTIKEKKILFAAERIPAPINAKTEIETAQQIEGEINVSATVDSMITLNIAEKDSGISAATNLRSGLLITKKLKGSETTEAKTNEAGEVKGISTVDEGTIFCTSNY